LTRNRLAKQRRGNRGRKQNKRQQQPLPACQHVCFTGTVKDDLARTLNGTDSSPQGKQAARGKQGNQENDDRTSAHKRRDYTTSQAKTLKVLTYCNLKDIHA